jgi:hypothetical protein
MPVRFQLVIDCALGATITCVLQQEGLDHYAVGMKDPEGNEFDIN